MFVRIAGWAQRHRWWALAAWVAVLIGTTAAGQVVGGSYHNDFSLPATDSQRALELLHQHFPARSGDTVQLVTRTPTDLAPVRALPHVADVSQYTTANGISYATITLDALSQDVPV